MTRRMSSPGIAVRVALWALLWVAPLSSARASHLPGDLKTSVTPAADLRGFWRTSAFTHLFELQARQDSDGRDFRAARIGTIFRAHENLKLGASIARRYGLRHDEDWVRDDQGNWHWQPTNGRAEDFFIADVTPQARLGFLSERNWAAELRVRHLWNTFNGDRTLKIRPGISYLWDPATVQLQYEVYFPLNYGVRTVYETWLYLGAIFPLSRDFQLGGFAARRTETWGGSDLLFRQTGNAFEIRALSYIFGITAIFRIGRIGH